MKNNNRLITNHIEYVIENMGKKVEPFNTNKIVNQFFTMDDIKNPTTNITPKLIREIMNDMVWPAMGKTQESINHKAFTSYKAVLRYFKKESEQVNVIRKEIETREVIKAAFRMRKFLNT